MVKSKKIIILLSFILSPIFMWGEINFFWDIGGGSIEGKIHKNDFKSDLSLQIQRGERIAGFIFRNGVTGKMKAGRIKPQARLP